MLGSSSCELGFSFRVRRDRVGPFALAPGRLPWGLVPLRGVSPASPRFSELPGSPWFRPQRFARSRRFAPRCTLQIYFALLPRPGFVLRGSSPDPAVPPRRWPLTSRRWRRVSVAGFPTTPSRVASTSGLCSGPGSAATLRWLSPSLRPCPVACSPSDSRCRPCLRDERRLHP
jgi:hypothetical protein